jgi:hypothetical protein
MENNLTEFGDIDQISLTDTADSYGVAASHYFNDLEPAPAPPFYRLEANLGLIETSGKKPGELFRSPQRITVDGSPAQRMVESKEFGAWHAEQPEQCLFPELVLRQLLIGSRIEPLDDLMVRSGAHVTGLVRPTNLPIPEPGHLIIAGTHPVKG